MLAIPVCAATSTGISPQSTDDVQFEFNFVALLGTHITDTNPDHMGWKENKSSVYLNVTQFPGNFYVYTNAYVNGSIHDCTQRPALVTSGGKWLIYNTIYEKYGNGTNKVKACLGGVRAQGGTASGKWSPDYKYYPEEGYIPPVNP